MADASGPWLVADVGGTNARFGWVSGAPGVAVQHIEKLPAAGHAGPVDAVHAYLATLRGRLGDAYRPPRRAAVAVATAITGDEVAFTNSHWRFSRTQLQAELGLVRRLRERCAARGRARHTCWPPRHTASACYRLMLY